LDELAIPTARVGPVPFKTRGVIVEIDDFKASIQLTQHLIDLGHKRIGFIRGQENQASTQIRFKGYGAALKSAGLTIDPDMVLSGQFDFASGLQAGEKFLSMQSPPSAVFAAMTRSIPAVPSAGLEIIRDGRPCKACNTRGDDILAYLYCAESRTDRMCACLETSI